MHLYERACTQPQNGVSKSSQNKKRRDDTILIATPDVKASVTIYTAALLGIQLEEIESDGGHN